MIDIKHIFRFVNQIDFGLKKLKLSELKCSDMYIETKNSFIVFVDYFRLYDFSPKTILRIINVESLMNIEV